ncbi:MAG: hypothetical protein FKY71_17460, partial [Spiribacter salinus]
MKSENSASLCQGSASRTRLLALALSAILASGTAAADATAMDADDILARLEALEARQQELVRELAERDQRIRELEKAAGEEQTSNVRAHVEQQPETVAPAVAQTEPAVNSGPRTAPPVDLAPERDSYGVFQPGGQGFKLVDTPHGD